LEFEGAPDGHALFDETERLAIEAPSAGMVTSRVTLLPRDIACRAETEVSMAAAADPDFAVTNPWNVVGPVVPASAVKGIFPRFVPPGTPNGNGCVVRYARAIDRHCYHVECCARWQRTEIKIAVGIGHCLFKDDVSPAAVLRLLLECDQHCAVRSKWNRLQRGLIYTCQLMPVLFVLTCPAVSTGFSRNGPLPCSIMEAQALKSIFRSTSFPAATVIGPPTTCPGGIFSPVLAGLES
jgi:hypothetical protein